jgi:hypothetical protein
MGIMRSRLAPADVQALKIAKKATSMASASSIMSFIGAVALANVFGFFSAVTVFAVIYAVLARFFAQRQHWAWITLTILSFSTPNVQDRIAGHQRCDSTFSVRRLLIAASRRGAYKVRYLFVILG